MSVAKQRRRREPDRSFAPILGRLTAILGLAAGMGASLCAQPTGSEPITFNDVGPVLHARCAPCHHPGGSGPFSLLTFRDSRRRARQIVDVTQSGYMPPWLPAPGEHPFVGERRLSREELGLLRSWVADGILEGDPELAPAPPEFPDAWELGTPDLVVQMPRPYRLAADGADVYRNFVLPAAVDGARWVEAVEFRPGNPRIVHHARLFVDRSTRSRREDARDGQPGFDGMDAGSALSPDGMLIGWTPGKVALRPLEGMAWPIDADTDIVLQLHLVPTGKPETIRSTVALHFTDRPPTLYPFTFVLGTRLLDIPAGESDYRVRDEYTLPVPVELHGIYPHAHYLGKRMQATARLPDGTRVPLLTIPRWDFNWQDEYRFARPVKLPRGATLEMEFSYDNSADNVFNPTYPPRRVRYGARTDDEMAELMLQVVPRDREARDTLERDHERKKARDAIAFRLSRLEDEPGEASHHAALGSTYRTLGDLPRALHHYREALRLDPEDALTHNNLGHALLSQGRADEALAELRTATRLRPDLAVAWYNLAESSLALGRTGEAEAGYREALRLEPGASNAHHRLAGIAQAGGRTDEAIAHLRAVLRWRPEDDVARGELAWLLVTHPVVDSRLPAEGLRLAETAAASTQRRDPGILATLAAALAESGRFEEAADVARSAIRRAASPTMADEFRRHLALYLRNEPYRGARER